MTRILTLNIWQEQGPWERRLELIAHRVAALAPDIICLQEVRQVPLKIPNQAETLARRFDFHWVYQTAQPWGGGDEGLAILSRYPIVEQDCQELPHDDQNSRRICLGAAVQLPETTFWVFTTHLEYRMAAGATRERQVSAADRMVKGHQVPGIAAVLTGDFNSAPDSDEMRYLRGLTSLEGRRTYYQDAYAQCNPGAPGHTWCKDNPYTKPLQWLEMDRRLDYIYVTPMNSKGAGKIVSCSIVLFEPDASMTRCSDHYGVMADVAVVTP